MTTTRGGIGEVLVAVLRRPLDMTIVREQLWYRIPVESADRLLKNRWPPQWLAFYQTRSFGHEAYSISYYGKVIDISEVRRSDLFPQEPADERSERLYYKLSLDRLNCLPAPVISRRLRRIVFIPTTWPKLQAATEVNDLFDDSPLEDILWGYLKKHGIPAERQELVQIDLKRYFLDFAIYCGRGKLDVETDGDAWHSNPERAPLDNLRDNDLHSAGWSLLRFNTSQIRDEGVKYCLPKVVETINGLGGVDEGGVLPRIIQGNIGRPYQMGLFENGSENG